MYKIRFDLKNIVVYKIYMLIYGFFGYVADIFNKAHYLLVKHSLQHFHYKTPILFHNGVIL